MELRGVVVARFTVRTLRRNLANPEWPGVELPIIHGRRNGWVSLALYVPRETVAAVVDGTKAHFIQFCWIGGTFKIYAYDKNMSLL